MIKDLSIAEALEYKEKLQGCQGVTDVIWLDDAVSIYAPLETADADTVEAYNKDRTALFTVTVAEDDIVATVDRLRTGCKRRAELLAEASETLRALLRKQPGGTPPSKKAQHP